MRMEDHGTKERVAQRQESYRKGRGRSRLYPLALDDICSGYECEIPTAQDVQHSLTTTGRSSNSNLNAKSTPASSLPLPFTVTGVHYQRFETIDILSRTQITQSARPIGICSTGYDRKEGSRSGSRIVVHQFFPGFLWVWLIEPHTNCGRALLDIAASEASPACIGSSDIYSNLKELTLHFSRPVKVLLELYPENTVFSPREYLINVLVRFRLFTSTCLKLDE
jgi:hypothetical protein